MIEKVLSALFKASENMRVTPGKHVDKIQQKPFGLEQNLAAEAAGEMTKTGRPAGPRTPDPVTAPNRQDQLAFVPLPLRTPLYEDARFYWKVNDFSATTTRFTFNTYFLPSTSTWRRSTTRGSISDPVGSLPDPSKVAANRAPYFPPPGVPWPGPVREYLSLAPGLHVLLKL